jgi:DNA-binding CsgD family transcriptional regulator
MAGLALRDLSALLLELHDGARELGYREQQRHTMKRVARALPFDAGLLAMGTFPRGRPPRAHDVWLYERPSELMESWEKIKSQDPAALLATSRPGVTAVVDVEGPLLDDAEDARAHCRAFRIAHIMTTAVVAPETGLYWVMSVYREDRGRPFTEAERAFKEAITPHVFSAAREARLGQLRRTAKIAPVHGQTAAIVNAHGTVLEADPELARLLRLEWPGWEGPELPRALAAEVERTGPFHTRHGPLVVRVDEAEGVKLLHVRRSVPADSLTVREREIAEGFSLGETHRELGDRLGISPNTVRRHLANIYEKLGISSKVELDRMLADV